MSEQNLCLPFSCEMAATPSSSDPFFHLVISRDGEVTLIQQDNGYPFFQNLHLSKKGIARIEEKLAIHQTGILACPSQLNNLKSSDNSFERFCFGDKVIEGWNIICETDNHCLEKLPLSREEKAGIHLINQVFAGICDILGQEDILFMEECSTPLLGWLLQIYSKLHHHIVLLKEQ